MVMYCIGIDGTLLKMTELKALEIVTVENLSPVHA